MTGPLPRARPVSAPQLAVVVALLLIAFFTRTHDALAMPAFNDESLHIRRRGPGP